MTKLEKSVLKTFEDVKNYFKTLSTPYYFVSPTAFNLIGLDKWVPSLRYITYIDTFDHQHPNVIVPTQSGSPVFNHLEEINTYLLGNKDVYDLISNQSEKPKIIFLFFNEELEELCKSLGCSIVLPEYKLVDHVDSKIVTTNLGNDAGVPSVPNGMGKVDSFKALQALAEAHNLGSKWVVQTAYGDSGKTTFFISTEEDYKKAASAIESENEVKVMKQIRCQSVAIEGCATRCGTFVGPLLSELIGEPSLTPYKGGWCGNDWQNNAFSPEMKQLAMSYTQRVGDALYKKGYRGYFEVDYLIDLDSNTVYLGELNPRLSGVTALTNSTPACQTQVPLFLFHLLEYSDVEWDIKPETYNAVSVSMNETKALGQLIFKYTESELRMIEKAPVSGLYRLGGNGEMHLIDGQSTSPSDISASNEAFFLRIMTSQEYAYKGGDLGILFTQTKVLNQATITSDGKQWVDAVRKAFVIRDLTQEEKAIVERYQNPGARFK